MSDMEQLEKRVAALESRLAVETEEDETKKEASRRNALLAEIASLESRLASDEDSDETSEEKTAADEECDKEEKTAADEDMTDEEKTASLLDPDGIEEQITQDYLSEVQDIVHGTELTDAPSMNELARKAYVTKLKNASARLDRVAEYLEKHGRRELAFRVDKIADAVDSKIKAVA